MSIYLNIAPCSWNKCKFCAYENLGKKGAPSNEELSLMIEGEFEKMKKGQKYVKIFNGGSWFWHEVPVEMRKFVYDFLEQKDVKKLRIENTFNLILWDEVKDVINRGFDLTISWGMEAANDDILKEVNKGVTLEKIERMLVRSKEVGVKNLLYLLAGLPGTTIDDFFHTIDWIIERKHLVDELSILTYVPIKGSVYYNELWKTNKFRVINKEEWKLCRDYAKDRTKDTHISISFETYHWRYLQGKTYDELYKKPKIEKVKDENVDGSSESVV
jgi:radical SAM enzyme (TIGR01210 family)